MPRRVTVTFADGSSHVYENAPDDVSAQQIVDRATREFSKPVKALDGGRGTMERAASAVTGAFGKAYDTVDRAMQPLRDAVGYDAAEQNRKTDEIARQIRERDQADLAKQDGMLDAAGDLFTRGMVGMGAGIERVASGIALNDAERQRFVTRARASEKIASTPIAGETTWDAATSDLTKLPGFLAEQAIASLPYMATAAAGPFGAISNAFSTTGQVAQTRAQNNGQQDATGRDVAIAAPAGVVSTVLDSLSLGSLANNIGGGLGRTILKDAATEGVTEGIQSGIEYAGGSVGTERGFSASEMGSQMLQGGLVGFGVGGMFGGVTEGGKEAFDAAGRIKFRRADDTRAPGPGMREQAVAEAANLTPEDLASPLDNADLAAGKPEIAKATAGKNADAALSAAGLPKVGGKVNVAGLPGGNALTGTIEDVFTDDTGAGVVVRPEGGGKAMREYLDTLNELGVSITPFDPTAEADAIDAALAAQASAPVEGAFPLPTAGAEVAPSSPSGRTPSALAGGATNFDIGSYMARVRQAESGGKDSAKAGTSSATGRYQFTDGTWLTTYKEVFGETGENAAQILAKRGDGAVQDRLMQKLTTDNAAALRAAGLPVNDTTLYLAHFAGIGGARSILKVAPERSVETVLGKKAVAANAFLKGKTAGDVIAWAAGKMGGEGVGGMVDTGPLVPEGSTQYADLPDAPQQSVGVTAAAPDLPTGGEMAGEQINKEWTAFAPDSGTIGIPRAEMPQIKAEHRGAMVNFLNARGIAHEEVTVPASALKPSQAEFSPSKVEKAKSYNGGNRAILISSDGHVVDGHHQWLAARDKDEDVRAIQLNAPIREVLQAAHEFPSSETAAGATPQQNTAGPQDGGVAPAIKAPKAGGPEATATDSAGSAAGAVTSQQPARVEDTGTGKSVAVIGASEAELAAITAAVPKAMGMKRKDGALVYSKKYADKIRAALDGVTETVTPAVAPKPAKPVTGLPDGYSLKKETSGIYLARPDGSMVGGYIMPSSYSMTDLGPDVVKIVRNRARDDIERRAKMGAKQPDRSAAIIMDPAAATVKTVPLGGKRTDEKKANPYVKTGERYTLKRDVDYLSAGGIYEVESTTRTDAYFRNVKTGGRTSVKNYMLHPALGNGVMVAVEPAEAEQQFAQSPDPVVTKEAQGNGSASPVGTPSPNRLVTDERAAELRERLKAKLNPGRLNSGIDPEIIAIGTELAVYHIEKGARRFQAFASAIASDLGMKVQDLRLYMRGWYNGARDMMEDAGESVAGMDTPDEVAKSMRTLETWANAEPVTDATNSATGAVDAQLPNRVPAGDAGPSASDVQGTSQDGGDERAPRQEGSRSPGDVSRPDGGRTGSAERSDSRPADGTGRDGAGVRDADSLPAGQRDTGRAGKPADSVKGTDWSIESGSLAEERSLLQKARDNVDAIALVKQIEREGRMATREEQATIARYVGWGGNKNIFPDGSGNYGKGFETLGPRLRELLTDEEYDTARRSIQYAHYTSEKVVRPMWDIARQLGFRGGMVFEPGMGSGNFRGMMPADLASASSYSGIEYDHLTASIAKLLYPQSGVRQADYTTMPGMKEVADLVIGNPPFSETVVSADPEYAKQKFVLHDFFFAKSLDAVKPGGLLMFITSAGTMNKVGDKARRWLADRADLVGSIRLPGNAFEQNAGTSVTTDIIILRKRKAGEAPGDQTWVDTETVPLLDRDGNTVQGAVNSYFQRNPEMVLGEQGMFDKFVAGPRYAVRAPKGFDLEQGIRTAAEKLAGDVVNTAPQTLAPGFLSADLDVGSGERKDGSFYVDPDGRLMQYRGGAGRPVQAPGKGVTGGMSAAAQQRVRGLIPVKNALREVYAADIAANEAEGTKAREALNKAYDTFVKQFGPINKTEISYRAPTSVQLESARAVAREEARLAGREWDDGSFDVQTMLDRGASIMEIARERKAAREAAVAAGRIWNEGTFEIDDVPETVIEKRPNLDPFMEDDEAYRLAAIEHYNKDTGEAAKGRAFFENAVKLDSKPTINSANDALLYSLNRLGRPDIRMIAEMAGKSQDDILVELADRLFEVPGKPGVYETGETYLSGNVREKLAIAQEEADKNPAFQRNVRALEAALPAPLTPSEIAANLGMPWIPKDVVKKFATEKMGLAQATVGYLPKLAQWTVTGDTYSAAARTTWGTERMDAVKILEAALNRQTPVVRDKINTTEGEKSVINEVATQAVQDKLAEMKAAFKEWVWTDDTRANALVDLYNRDFNSLVAPSFDGTYLTTPGVASGWDWRPHQRAVIARIIQSGNTYMAHEVGAGKTSAMIGSGMEMKRLGLVDKPMYVVPNHMLGQFTKEFYEQYPLARILVADEQRFHTSRRKEFIARMAAENWDAIIITHSAFGFIPMSENFTSGMIQQQIDDLEDLLSEIGKGQDVRITRRKVEQQKEALEQRLRGMTNRKRDQVFTFEETGVDFMFVDEAHLFRKLDFATKMGNVKGIDPAGSQMSFDLYAKSRYLEGQRPGRNLVLASGTPITNTMAELFSVSRYLQQGELEKRGLGHFDAWAGAFGDTVTALEQDAAGGYKPVTRFAQFVNVPELSVMVRQVMDVVGATDLRKYVSLPNLKGGSRQLITVEMTPLQEDYKAQLQARMEAIKARSGPPKKGDDILLSVIGDGRKAAIDYRLIDPTVTREEGSKLERMIDEVARRHKEFGRTAFFKPLPAGKGFSDKPVTHGPATQMIFSDFGINGDFPVHKYIRNALIARGIPSNQIALIQDFKTHVAKARLFNDMNEGKVRVLIGSVAKMGTGVNAQKRLRALHNMDAQWYPANDTQRNGRIMRQGNMNPEIEILDYATNGTYDSTMWGLMAKKARFIEGFMRGDPTMRDMEDLGEASQYEQASAMTTADPRIMELTEWKQDLEKIERRQSAHERSQQQVRSRIAYAESAIEESDRLVPLIEQDIAARDVPEGEEFTATVGKETFSDRGEYGAALFAFVDDLLDRANGKALRESMGKLAGFSLDGEASPTYDGMRGFVYIKRAGRRETRVELGTDSRGLVTRLLNTMRKFDSDLSNEKARKTLAEREIADFTPQLGQRFDDGGKGAEIREKIARLEGTLKAESEAAEAAAKARQQSTPQQSIPEASPTSPTGDVKAALREQLANLRLADKIKVRLVDTLGGAAGEYRAQIVTIAQDTPQGEVFTLNHEAIHALRDLGLFNTSEWAILSAKAKRETGLMRSIRQRYEAGFRERGMTGAAMEEALVEEAVADMFARHQDGRYKAEGTTERLFKMLRQFFEAVRNAFAGRGLRTAEGVMQDVAAGDVGARDSQGVLKGSVRGSRPDASIKIVAAAAPPMGSTFGERRLQAKTAAIRMFAGSTVTNVKEGRDISINAASVRHSLDGTRSVDDLSLALTIPDLLREAYLVRTEPGRTGGQKHDFYAAARMQNGDIRRVKIVVNESASGMLMYSQHIVLPKEPVIEGGAPGSGAEISAEAPLAGQPDARIAIDDLLRGVKNPDGTRLSDERAGETDAQFSIPERDDLVALGGTEPTWKAKGADAFDKWRTAMQDRYLPLLKVQRQIEEQTGKSLPVSRNPYMGEELMTGRIGARLEKLAEEHVQPLFDAMHADKITTEELVSFLYARHAPERNARKAEINPDFTEGEGSGMTDLEAAAIMSRVRKAGKMEAMERLAARVDQIRESALDYRVQTGLISKEDADEWRSTYQFYVPLRGFKETGTDAIPERMNRSGGGINVRGRESRQAFGRRSQADSPLAYLILQAEEAIVRGETNIVAARFYNLAKASPDEDFWKINKVSEKKRLNEESGLVESYLTHNLLAEDKDWTVSAKINGREVRVTMNKENLDARRLADAMRNLTQHQLDWVTLHMGKVNRFLSAVNTSYNPEFIITNAFRDLQTATLNLSGEGVKGIVRGTLKDYRSALTASMKGAFGKQSGEWGKWYDEFTMNGGRVYFNKVENVEEIKGRIAKAAEMAQAKAGEGGPRLQAKRMFLAARDFIENTNNGVENAVRLSVYKNAREAGLTPTQAASIAKNVTVNFNRRGTAGPAMNAAYLFFNASVQGSARIVMALRSPRVRKMVAGIMIAAAAAEMLNAMMSADDDDGESIYDKIPGFEKSRNIVLMMPDGKSYIKIPMPYGYNAFWEAGRSAAEMARRGGDRWKETMGNLVGTVADAFNPIGGSNSLLNMLSPTITDPIVDLTLNKDFTGKPIMPNQSPYGTEEPDNQRYFNSVAPHWRAITDFFNTASGGDEVMPGAIDVSPETLEYLAGTVVGAAGGFLDRIATLAGKGFDESEEVTANDIPLARKVIGSKPSWVDKASYYDRVNRVEQEMSYVEDYLDAGKADEARSYVESNRNILTLEGAAKQAKKDMREVRKARREIVAAKERGQIDDATYRQKKEVVDRADKLVVTEFNAAWNQAMQTGE